MLAWLPLPEAGADEPVKKDRSALRQYRQGLLGPTDFRGKAPRNGTLAAYTLAEIHYDCRFQVTGTRNRWTARLMSVETYASIDRDRSWNLRPQDSSLMDHEQGHFDLAHSFSLAMQLYLNERMKARRIPIGIGKTSSEAIRDLEDKLRAELKSLFDDHTTAQSEYDRITDHGTDPSPQAEQRRLQKAKIEELNAQLEKLKKPRGK
jgi:hypothetical protein